MSLYTHACTVRYIVLLRYYALVQERAYKLATVIKHDHNCYYFGISKV